MSVEVSDSQSVARSAAPEASLYNFYKNFGNAAAEKVGMRTLMKVLALGLGIIFIIGGILFFCLLPGSCPYFLTVFSGVVSNSLGVALVTGVLIVSFIERYLLLREPRASYEELLEKISRLELQEIELLKEKEESKKKFLERFEAQSAQIVSLEEERNAHAAELITIKERCDELSQENSGFLQKIQSLGEELVLKQSDRDKEVSDLSDVLDALRMKSKTLVFQLTSLKGVSDEGEAFLSDVDLQEDSTEQEDAHTLLTTHRDDLRSAVALAEDLTARIQALSNEKSCLESVVKDLSEKIEKLTEEKFQEKRTSDIVISDLSKKLEEVTEEKFRLKQALDRAGQESSSEESTGRGDLKAFSSKIGGKVSGFVGGLLKKPEDKGAHSKGKSDE
ncbi:hypothetical protein [Chlamydiifrater phoenicopteri]|uniref:hypothetical protein n=1 Tax=Chlamydiifrater phoenicopteri TaxID=2681469 RepID=UPI001BD11332|nr:hypothetical protein [Chlamydiifrater phoenicopteri]